MATEENNEPKRGFPGNFLVFLVMAIFLTMMVQQFFGGRTAKVAFNYEVEHLVNLDLIVANESRKTAGSDQLVTFSGRFKDTLSEEAKHRYKYLTFLHENRQLNEQEEDSLLDLQEQRSKVGAAAETFLALSGLPIPSDGYNVVGKNFNRNDNEFQVLVTEAAAIGTPSLRDLQLRLQRLQVQASEAEITAFGQDLDGLVTEFRSPELGLGNEALKKNLRRITADLQAAEEGGDLLAVYTKTLSDLQGIVETLDAETEEGRLKELRSVRDYRLNLQNFADLDKKLEDNGLHLSKARDAVGSVIWFFNNQELSTRSLEKQNPELLAHWYLNAKEEWDAFDENRGGFFRAHDQPLNLVLEKTFRSELPAPNYFSYLFTILPVLLILGLLYFVFTRQMKGVGNSAMNFGKSPAKLLTKDKNKITFKDVAGIDEALEELEEIVEFLKNPGKFTKLGGRMPKGVLCIGSPGTGKTLVAKAIAGEADCPFFSISGSDFVEMFVGVGASRIRDMFSEAKKNAPCIIFMDEIDAVGRHRGGGVGGGHDEREQTLNQLLVEMDGFESGDGVILMAATNRPDVLDKALLRPGRFDRQIVINLPDLKGRLEILKVHARRVKLDESVELMDVARGTPGSSGADLENILNEAALLAARRNRTAVTQAEVAEARDKVLYGKERRSMELDEKEKWTTAIHESGHAIVGLFTEQGDDVDKVTIIPRGLSLGATHFLPEKNKVSYWKKELAERLAMMMGGRVAEEIFLGDVCSGAQQDIEQATRLARSMVTQWGMSNELGLVAYAERSESGQYLGGANVQDKSYSEKTAEAIDGEVRRIVDDAHRLATDLITEHKGITEEMAKMLMKFETLDRKDCELLKEGKFDIAEKEKRLEEEREKHKAAEPPPLPEQEEEKKEESFRADPMAGSGPVNELGTS